MDLALLLIVNGKSDIKIDRTLCNYMTAQIHPSSEGEFLKLN